ncbi:hypothetical protein DFH94DRAFT_71283 [Russula ochroleuca]|uniref:Uncharacterized protein n=1 Tax=Russula ochroleuca TaxID=152965 RepID=A0A9P5JTX7_9AGAM|nr:hypothetical protein DFH94DRAFT_71283 [Russula ochroleuca]
MSSPSWGPGSFGNSSCYFPGSSPNQHHSPLECVPYCTSLYSPSLILSPFLFVSPVDPRYAGNVSAFVEPDRGSIMNPLSTMQRESESYRNYTCCGLNLQDRHAIMEHFEESHVVDPCSQLVSGQPYPHNCSSPFSSPTHDPYVHHSAQVPHPQERHRRPLLLPQYYQRAQQQHQQGPFHPDDMGLYMNSSLAFSSASSTPISPVITPFVPYTTQQAFTNTSSFTPSLAQPSLECPSHVSAFDTVTVLPSRASTSTMSAFSPTRGDSFNTYSAYSDCSAVASPLQASQEITSASSSQPANPYCCISPTQLYNPNSITPANIPSSSRVASPLAPQGQTEVSYHPLSSRASRSTSSLHSTKPRCPKPNHNKSYKHLNELRYHVTHGQSNFVPLEDSEAPQTVLAEKGSVNWNDSSGVQVSERELHETECRLRPFACGIDNCQRRYTSMKGLQHHYQHSRDHGVIGLQLLASGQHECLRLFKSAAATCQTTLAHSARTSPSSPSASTSGVSQPWHHLQGFGQFQYSPSNTVKSRPSPQECVPTSPPVPPGKLLSDRVRKISTDDPQCVDVISTPSSLAQEYVPTSQSSPSRIRPPPDKFHPTLSSWLKNINKLDNLINGLRELASSAPAECRSQLLNKVAALHATFKRQQERFNEFLQLSEEYANKYLLDISVEIRRQRTVLDYLEKRLEAAKKLHGEAVILQMFYESETVATMKHLRATGEAFPGCLPRHNPETSDYQDFRGRFQRTRLCSARWIRC